ncbi:MAG TPA: DUF72 domain-containing protein [Kofleriaceae bacterium]
MAAKIEIGLCGFSMAQSRYPSLFPVVEIQHTFYQPPAMTLLARWRNAAPADFEFTIKAWQLITHPGSSPTYRRLKRALTERERAEAGWFRASAIVDEAWRTTVQAAATLRARAILFQCPASFKPTPDNLAAVRAFFDRIDRPAGVRLMFEPRGPAWTSALGRSLCDELGAVHVVDPFVTAPIDRAPDPMRYFRLHGVTGARHVYTDAELTWLAALARRPASGRTYVMFNNIPRVADAQRFARLLELPAR